MKKYLTYIVILIYVFAFSAGIIGISFGYKWLTFLALVILFCTLPVLIWYYIRKIKKS